ncbi:MAG: HisA/HisF-related TIM barrel protein, partial [Dokdonella sp.]
MTCTNDFEVIPAIDLRGGRVVRLYQGDYARQTDYAVEPLALAQTYAAAGARWLHVVDLDGAQQGASLHVPLLQAMAASGMHIQAGGGVRGEEDLQRLFDAGVSRVVVGSVAMRAPELVISWLQRYGAERITVALDTRYREGVWRLASAGWTETETATLDELAPRYAAAGARHVLCT